MIVQTPLTSHAATRIAQRGIPPLVLDLLCQFGASERCKDADKLFFDKQSRRQLKRYLGGERSLKLLEPWLNTYAVLGDDGKVVTAGQRQKRITRS